MDSIRQTKATTLRKPIVPNTILGQGIPDKTQTEEGKEVRPIPKALRDELSRDRYYKTCARKGADCKGRITWEHALRFAGKQINERWSILPLCWHHHLGKGLNKRINEFLALQRATDADLDKYPKSDFRQMRSYLRKKFDGIIQT